MVKVLHLIDPGSPGGGACTLRLLAEPLERLRSISQDVIIVGTRTHARLAARCGVDVGGIIGAPLGQPAFARRPLARTIDGFERRQGRYDLIHAWTPQSALLATLAAPDHRRVATLSVGPITGIATQALTLLLEQNDMPLLATSSAVEAEYRSLGVNEQSLSVLPPAVNVESVERIERETLRHRWAVEEQTFVIGLLSEPTCWADARIAVDVLGRVRATGRPVRLLVHDTATRRLEAQRWAQSLGWDELVIVDDEVAEPWRVVSGLDAALLIGGELNRMDLSDAGSPFAVLTGGGRRLRPMPGIMPLLWACSAGVPVIAEASDAVRDVLQDGHSGLLVDQFDVNTASDRIIRLHDDPTIAGRIGMQARSLVHERFHISAYCVRLREIYERLIANRPTRVIGEPNPPMVEQFQRKTTTWTEVRE
jgi:glycosyltransferase involved in cell wall biosynthesis